MQKYITKRNLMILNAALAVILLLTGFLGIVYPIINAKPVETTIQTDLTLTTTASKKNVRPARDIYELIIKNDLFVYKGPVTGPIKPTTTVYDLTKVWELNGAFNSIDGPHAWIKDKGLPDPVTKQPFTIHEVFVGKILESDKPPRVFNVEILEIAKDPETNSWYIKYYRHDMVDAVEEDRVFVLSAW